MRKLSEIYELERKHQKKIEDNSDLLLNWQAFLIYIKTNNKLVSTISVITQDQAKWGIFEKTKLYIPAKRVEAGEYCGSFVVENNILVDAYRCKEFGYKLVTHMEDGEHKPANVLTRFDLQTGQYEPWLEIYQDEAEQDKKRKNSYFKRTLERAEKEGIPGREIIAYCDIVSMVDWVLEVKEHDPDPEDVAKVVRKAFAWDYADKVLGSWTRDVAPTFPLLMKTLQAYLELVV